LNPPKNLGKLQNNHQLTTRYDSRMKKLRIIAAGGTFDKRYNPLNGALHFTVTHLHSVLQRCRLNTAATISELPLLDSLDMQDADRQRILDACVAAPEQHIVVVHGTDTMPETAQVLGLALNTAVMDSKTVVITGAMVPYDIEGSDALFNLGFAAATAQSLPAGVYIAMGGEVFHWDNVRKDRAAGRFMAATAAKTV
jgi:L-asparaginase